GRAAAAREEDDVDVAHLLQDAERAAERVGRAVALDRGRREENARAAAPEGDLADVVDDRAARARDDADRARLGGQGALALGREEPFGRELLFEPLERLEDRPASGRVGPIGD